MERSPGQKHGIFTELAVVVFMFVVVNVASNAFQRPISLSDGLGWDGVFYGMVADQLAHHGRPTTDAPFVYRLGTPLLVALFFKSDLLRGFRIVNIAGNFLAALLLVFWLRFYLRERATRLLLATLFLLGWNGPVRFVHYYAAYADPWLFVVLLAGLIGIRATRDRSRAAQIAALAIVTCVGVVFREAALILPVAFLFSTNPLGRPVGRFFGRIPVTSWVPLILGVVAYRLVVSATSPTNEYTFLGTAFEWAYEKPFLTYLHAWFVAFGPLVLLPVFAWRRAARFLAANQFLAVTLLAVAGMAWIGGSDTERVLLWGLPVVYVLVGNAIEDNAAVLEAPLLRVVLVVSQLVSMRVPWTIPDYPGEETTLLPVLTIPSSGGRFFDLLSYHGNREIEVISLCEYLILGAIILWWLNHRARRIAGVA